MRNLRTDGNRIDVTAAAARTSGVPCVEAGFAGFPYTDAIVGQIYALDIAQSVKELALIGGAAVGNSVHITDATGALTVTAFGTAGAVGTRLFGRVVAIPTDPAKHGPPAGAMWVIQGPQTATTRTV